MSTTTTITKQCQCGASFQCEPATKDPAWPYFSTSEQEHCHPCIDRLEAEATARKEEQQRAECEERALDHQAKVDRMTPDRLLTPDLGHKEFNAALWRKVKAWEPSKEKPWLGIIGETGSCKTRCAFLRLREFARYDAFHFFRGQTFDMVATSGSEFNRIALEKFSDETLDLGVTRGSMKVSSIASKGLREFRKTGLLLFDEIGKVRPTPAIIDELFALIDYRHSHNLQTIWTANRAPEQFCSTWPEEYAAPGGGRILESSTIIRS